MHQCVGKLLLLGLQVLQTDHFVFVIATGFHIWVSGALLDSMPLFFAAHALLQLTVLQLPNFRVLIVFPDHDVLAKLAPKRVLACFAAAPPHLPGPLGLVHATRPVIVLRVFEVLFAIIAHFRVRGQKAALLQS